MSHQHQNRAFHALRVLLSRRHGLKACLAYIHTSKYVGIVCVFFLFPHTFTFFPPSGQAVVTSVVLSPPPVLAFNFYRAEGSAIPLLVDFSSSVANSRSRVFRKSICAQVKVPTNLYEYALGGIRTYETDLNQARG